MILRRRAFLAAFVCLSACGGGGSSGSGSTSTGQPTPTPTAAAQAINALPLGITTAGRLSYPVAIGRPYPATNNYSSLPQDGTLSGDYFSVATATPSDLFLGVSGVGLVELRSASDPYPGLNLTLSEQLRFVRKADGLYITNIAGLTNGQRAFGNDNLISESIAERLFARVSNVGFDTREEAFVVRKVGAGTPLPNNVYATNGFAGFGWGSTNAEVSFDERNYFVLGSQTKFADLPASGTRTYTIAKLEGDAYRGASRYPVTGTAVIVADFTQKKVTLDITLSASSPNIIHATLTHTNFDLTQQFGQNLYRGSFIQAVGLRAVGASATFFGPTASELGIAFNLYDKAVSAELHVFLHGSILAYAQ